MQPDAPRVAGASALVFDAFPVQMVTILHVAALVLYALATGLFVLSLVRKHRALPPPATLLLSMGLATHAGSLATFVAHWGELPLVGLGPSLSTLAFLIAVGSLMVATVGRVGPLGLVLVPVVTLILAAALLVGIQPTGEPTRFSGAWFVLHVLLALVGYAGLTMAFAAGLMYLMQFRELKSKRFGAIFHFFPPLDTLDRIGRRALLVGFPALTLALVLGAAWIARFPEPAGPGNSHILWGVVTWAVLLVALLVRAGGGRREHRAAVASVLGFVVVVLMFLLLRSSQPQGGAFL
jgi:HemX protein